MPSPPPTARSPRRAALALLAALLLALAGLGAALVWAAASPTGTRTLLAWVPGLRIAGVSGALLGDFAAEQAELALPRGGSLALSRLRWQGLRLERDDKRAAAWALRLSIARLSAERAELHWVGDPTPSPPPESLHLPLAVDIAQLRVGEFRFDPALAPLRELSLGLHLAGGAAGGAAGKEPHRIENLSLRWERLQADGRLTMGADAPMPLDAQLAVKGEADAQADLPAFDARLSARGPLQHFKLETRLRAEQQTLDAQAQIQPFAAWPLAELNASTRGLDLAALWSAAPRTALSGHVVGHTLSPSGKTQPLSLKAELQNGAAGRWDERKLPLRSLSLAIAGDIGSLQQRGELRLERLELGSARQPAGKLSATGRWDGPAWRLDAQVLDLAPAALDQRAPAVVLSGPLALNGRGGLPSSPAPAPASAPGAAGSASPVEIGLSGRLQGRLLGAPGQGPAGPLTLLLDAGLSPQRISVRQLEAKAAGASARLKGEAELVGASAGQPSAWQLRGTLALADLDPRPWWAATRPQAGDSKPAADAASKAAAPAPPPRINADAQFDLRIPQAKAASGKPHGLVQQLAAWRGQAKAQLRDSQFGGVPLAGEFTLESQAARRRLLGHARLEAGGNQLLLDGEIDATAAANDRWKLQLQAPKLDGLAPLLRLLQPASPPQAYTGALTAQAEAEGRWPSLHSRGELQAQGLSLPSWSVASAQVHWDLGTTPDAAVSVQAEASQVALGQRKLDLLRAQLSGTGRSHQASLRIEAPPLRPANGAAQGNGSPLDTVAEQRLLALLAANGGWSRDERAASLSWQGRVQQLELRALPPGAVPASNLGTAWLHADPFELSWTSGMGSQRLSVSPTRLSVSDATLKLSRFEWSQQAGAVPRFDLQAELEPLKLAPLLARAQPDFGWAGDLTVGGHLMLHSDAGSGFRADVLLERSAGDLEVVDPAQLGARPLWLGLSEARLALSADDGLWQFSQRLAGANLGLVSGEQTVSTRRELSWPEPAAPLQGLLDIRVANLATWGAWVPPGWRLSGQLATQASVGGRFGAPEYTGRLSGSHIGVRNVLAGVNLSEGEVEIALQGDTARIERFSVRGGQGQARLEGEASLGAAPHARLQLSADRFAVLSRVDRRLSLSGQAQLELQGKAVKLDGRLVADSGLVDISRGGAPSLADDVVVVRRRGDDAAAPPPEPAKTAPRMSHVALNLKLDLGPDFRLRGHGLDTLLRGELAVTTPGGLMNVNGSIRTEQGSYAAYAQKLDIERGIISFDGPVENPRLDILALRKPSASAIDNDVKVGVAITGSAQNPRVRLYSEPEMADTDKLSWLVLGRASSGLGGDEAALIQQAAMALLAGEGEGGSGDLLRGIGLDELSVRQNDAGTVHDTVVSLGRQLSQRWYVGYERSLNATTGTWQLIYRVARSYTLRAQSGLDNSLDLIWTWRWN